MKPSANNRLCSPGQHLWKWVQIKEVVVLGYSILVRSCIFCSQGHPLKGTLVNGGTSKKRVRKHEDNVVGGIREDLGLCNLTKEARMVLETDLV